MGEELGGDDDEGEDGGAVRGYVSEDDINRRQITTFGRMDSLQYESCHDAPNEEFGSLSRGQGQAAH